MARREKTLATAGHVPRSNPEVVGSMPTEVKRFFLYLACSLIPFTRANAQWVIHGLNFTSE